MAESELLLSYLFPKFRGSKEDIVTLALCHVLKSSEEMREAFTDELCRRLYLEEKKGIRFHPQATGKNLERPDISGVDSTNSELLICEAKFFAGLTDNQPVAYLDRLIGRSNTGLIFICPETRVISLWNQIIGRVRDLQPEPVGEKCVSIRGVHMSIISWTDLLGVLFQIAKKCDDNIVADLNQLEGLCKKIEKTEFIPFSDDDLSVATAKNIDRYYFVIDDIVNLLCHQEEFPVGKFRPHPTGVWGGYVYYIVLWKLSVGFDFSTGFWKSDGSETTPFWVWFSPVNGTDHKDEVWKAVNSMLLDIPEWNKCVDKNGVTHLALVTPRDAFREDVANELAEQTLEYMRIIKEKYDEIMKSIHD